MRIPDSPSDPRPRRPIPGRPKKPSTPGLPQSSGKPATRAEFARLRAILDQDSATDLGDLIIRWGEGQPSEDALAALGDTSRELVEWATAHSEEVARRVATDRAFADLLASDPVAALKQIGTVPPVTPTTGPTTPQPPPRTRPDRDVPPAAAEVFGALGGRRFDIPVELLGRQAVAEDLTVTQSAALGLLGETMQAALATPKGWPDLRSDPPAAVLAASKRFAWTAVGVSPDSAEAASVVQQVSASLVGALQWTGSSTAATAGSSSGSTGATGPGPIVSLANPTDVAISAGRIRTVRIPPRGKGA